MADDPDRGSARYTYDELDQLTSTEDVRGTKLFFGYDEFGRKTETREGSTTGALLAQWVYDTVAKGQLTSATRFVGGHTYTGSVRVVQL